jgi:hypothetical protein
MWKKTYVKDRIFMSVREIFVLPWLLWSAQYKILITHRHIWAVRK